MVNISVDCYFYYQKMIPLAPTLPLCNGPGSEGHVSIGTNAAGDPEYIGSNTLRVMGSGNTVRDLLEDIV